MDVVSYIPLKILILALGHGVSWGRAGGTLIG